DRPLRGGRRHQSLGKTVHRQAGVKMKTIRFGAAVLALLALAGVARAAEPEVLRIGFQKGSTSLVLAKEHRMLEQRFPEVRVQWIEFPAGPQMLEALNIGSLDVGSTGDI